MNPLTNPVSKSGRGLVWLLFVTLLFAVRLAITLIHGHAHDTLEVPLAAWQQVYVWGVIMIGPTAALVWLWIRPSAVVAWGLAAILVASWLFGFYFHFGPPNPDHVSSQVGPHAPMFKMTALGLLIVEPLAALAAGGLARVLGRQGGLTHA